MSSYHNSFYEGPNDPPPKVKPMRTNHPTWSDIGKSVTKKHNPTDPKVKKALKDAGVD